MFGEAGTVKEEVLIQRPEHLQELFPEQEGPKSPDKCGLNVQQGVLPVEKPKENCCLPRDVDDGLRVLLGIPEADDPTTLDLDRKRLDWPEAGILIGFGVIGHWINLRLPSPTPGLRLRREFPRYPGAPLD
jgi:hypothetical protein